MKKWTNICGSTQPNRARFDPTKNGMFQPKPAMTCNSTHGSYQLYIQVYTKLIHLYDIIVVKIIYLIM